MKCLDKGAAVDIKLECTCLGGESSEDMQAQFRDRIKVLLARELQIPAVTYHKVPRTYQGIYQLHLLLTTLQHVQLEESHLSCQHT